MLTRLIARELVEDLIASTERGEKRERLLLARVTMSFLLALAMFHGDSFEEVMRKLARDGAPLRELFERLAESCTMRSAAGAWLGGRKAFLMNISEQSAHITGHRE